MGQRQRCTAAFYNPGVEPPLGDESIKSFRRFIDKEYGTERGPLVAKQYDPARFYNGSTQAAFIQADCDSQLRCPSRTIARALSAAGVRTHFFEFAHFSVAGCDSGVTNNVVPKSLVPANRGWAGHGADVQFTFGTEVGPDSNYKRRRCAFDPEEQALSLAMRTFWTSTMDADSDEAWRPFSPQEENVYVFATSRGGGQRLESFGDSCEFWDELFN